MRDIWQDQGTPPRRHENAPENEAAVVLNTAVEGLRQKSRRTEKPVPPLKRALSNEDVEIHDNRYTDEVLHAYTGRAPDGTLLFAFGAETRPSEPTPDPVRRATRERIRAWQDGERGTV